MCNNQPTAITRPTAPEAERPGLVKKIGKTAYRVKVHFSTTGTETMSDKIKRMLCNEVQQLSPQKQAGNLIRRFPAFS